MVVLSHSAAICSGLIRSSTQPKLSFRNRNNYNGLKVTIPRGHIGKSSATGLSTTYVVRTERGSGPYQSSFDDEWLQEPFLLTLVKEAVWGIRSVFVFLVEQPSQLKYIEWPAFSSTLKTATLTLVLVAMLIVALSSIDSALSYLLALLLRRTP